ncbi:Rha family transcriptional regulator [Sediminibacillus terrae]|uniref:Rha family transcriptional regulator n=1 Tax=Sediminibacillus terrae TaxID=1562106 RepID=UPI0012979902|nr:Rha family transcriptional regulator [Sediminibacillus terrae]
MSQLVFVKDKQVVTDSLTVAQVFGKSHDKILRDVRDMECSQEFSLANFGESTYVNDRGREYPKIIMTEQGFTILAMGYTGSEAMRFKEQYINEFHKMREQLTNNVKVLDDRTALIQSLKITAETAEKQEQMQDLLNTQQLKLSTLETKVDEQITLNSGEQRRFQKGVARRVYSFTEDRDEASRLFRELYREIKDRFGVGSYKDVKREDLQSALAYIENWIPRQVS